MMLLNYRYGGKFVDRKKNKQRNFTESETKHLVRSHNKNAVNAIFRTLDAGTSILGERYNAGSNNRSKEEREAPYAVDGRHQKCNLLTSVSERQEKWRTLVNNTVKKRNGPMFNPRRRQRQTTALRMLPSTSARITRSLTDYAMLLWKRYRRMQEAL